jgi:hypothetical protein
MSDIIDQTKIPDENLAYRLGHEAGFRSALFQAAALIQKTAKDRNRSDVNASRMAAAILDIKDLLGVWRMSDQITKFDVIATSIATREHRTLATGKSERDAETIIKIAVFRLGVDDEFFSAIPSTADRIAHCRLMAEESRRSPIGSEAEASEWDDRARRLENGMDEDDGWFQIHRHTVQNKLPLYRSNALHTAVDLWQTTEAMMTGIVLWAVLSTLCGDNGICATTLTPTGMMDRNAAERVAETMREGGVKAEVVEYGTVADGKFILANQ